MGASPILRDHVPVCPCRYRGTPDSFVAIPTYSIVSFRVSTPARTRGPSPGWHQGQELKAGREAKGFNLADIYERMGMDRSALSKLENVTNESPTIDALLGYA